MDGPEREHWLDCYYDIINPEVVYQHWGKRVKTRKEMYSIMFSI